MSVVSKKFQRLGDVLQATWVLCEIPSQGLFEGALAILVAVFQVSSDIPESDSPRNLQSQALSTSLWLQDSRAKRGMYLVNNMFLMFEPWVDLASDLTGIQESICSHF